MKIILESPWRPPVTSPYLEAVVTLWTRPNSPHLFPQFVIPGDPLSWTWSSVWLRMASCILSYILCCVQRMYLARKRANWRVLREKFIYLFKTYALSMISVIERRKMPNPKGWLCYQYFPLSLPTPSYSLCLPTPSSISRLTFLFLALLS